MHSLRTKITAVTISAIIITMIIATIFGVAAIRDIGQKNSEQMLMLLCEAGEKNLDSSLLDVEQDVETISAYVEEDLTGLDDERLSAHLNRVSEFFRKVLYKTNGVITYYYRIDPSVSSNVPGFWFVNENGEGFQEHEVTDITRYDTEDTSQLVWFTVPKATGKSIWLPPYITDNLGARVISYNTPVYLNGTFVGVIGIELDYSFMAEEVDNITAYESFVVDTTTCEDFSTDENSEAYNLFKDETKNVYGFTNRLKELNKSLTATSASPSLLCKDENKIKEKVGTLSIDELFLIGNATTTLSKNKNGMNAVSYNYLMNTKDETFFTISPSINNEYYIGQMGVGTTIISDTNNSEHALLPTITIKGGILYTSGNGTYKDPYVIG